LSGFGALVGVAATARSLDTRSAEGRGLAGSGFAGTLTLAGAGTVVMGAVSV
jgi:hypothetical protein